jgi:hypothetical protein
MEQEVPTYSIPAQVYLQLLLPNQGHPAGVGQHGYGAFGNFFGSLARTARNIIFPNLVRLGKNVISDVMQNNQPILDIARNRTMQAMQNVVSDIQSGKGKRKKARRSKKRKSAPRHKKQKRGHHTKAKAHSKKKRHRKRKSSSRSHKLPLAHLLNSKS